MGIIGVMQKIEIKNVKQNYKLFIFCGLTNINLAL